ncbi:phage tail protein I [Endozoicomonas gorgoniicola]|uniref:Phage tail protein I n=1 Tax=Endozoicomonas gorgoniicola TaxID=1234144 RepID=A0ABT3MX63_9GAMM|nr:phage tail protein I [Endozoicomonas gorgoniicola]MCW7553648.1 phage tail protein I [Endozoicomonas gorgoniicola]
MVDLLPPSATPQERALAKLDERLDKLPVPHRDLWNPDTCPLHLLPYLAFHYSVDQWNDNWPEHIKRQSLKDALYQHRIKGSLQAVENAIARFGTTANITEWWQQSPKGLPHTFSVDISAQDNERQLPVFEIGTGDDVWLFCGQAIPVQTSRVYRVRFKVRQTVDNSGSDRVYAGVATLDKDFNALTGGPGFNRYCCVVGRSITTADGWQVFEGEITGEGNANHNQFRPDTAYIRPMFIVNYNGGTGTAQVAELECWDLFENRQLVPNPRFENGKQGWSTRYTGKTVPDNAPGTIKTAAFRPDADLQDDIINAIKQAKPLRSDFNFNVGTVHAAPLELSAHVHQVVLSRETWE